MTIRILTSILAVALIGASGCSTQPAAKTESGTPNQPASQAAPAGSAAMPSRAPLAGPDGTVQSVTGVVMETMNARTYTYVRIKAESGEIWAASGQFKVAVGDRVVVPLETPMSDFHSAELNRDFKLIYFASRITLEGETAQPAMMSAHGSTPAGSPTAAVEAPQVVTKVAPAEGGMTIADVWAKRKSLGGKTVVIRGKVVKFNGGILGVNWLHLQDGTGTSKDGTHDITITSLQGAKVGDIITATGKIALDKDLGSGYSYPVILEDATVVIK